MSGTLILLQIVLLLLCCLFGIFLIYRLNDCIDQDADFKFNLRHFFSYRIHTFITLLLFVLLIPFCFYFLSSFTLIVLSVISIMGVLYSLSFRFGDKLFRIKNVFLLKNVFIGIAWGSLILIGAGEYSGEVLLTLFIFASVQVLIGSIIRDVPDENKDRTAGVKSLPVVFGSKWTFFALHVINFASLAAALLSEFPKYFLFLFGYVVTWRFINILFLNVRKDSAFWSQFFNLSTCVLILILVYIFKINGFLD